MSESFRNPLPTVDVIIEIGGGIVLIERKNPPPGWALPGGFVDYGESVERAAVREAAEETCLEVKLTEQFYTYSDPQRDPRLQVGHVGPEHPAYASGGGDRKNGVGEQGFG